MVDCNYKIVLFYRYVALDNVHEKQQFFLETCQRLGLLGRVLVAPEGINGTLAGPDDSVGDFIAACSSFQCFQSVDWKVSACSGATLPFNDLHIKFVFELIGCGSQRNWIDNHVEYDVSTFGGLTGTGVHLSPSEFHEALTCQPTGHNSKSILLDIRNEFEYDIGHFRGAASLGTNTYAETWKALDTIFDEATSSGVANREKEVYMYCTGGIRCEKASAYLKSKGIHQVFQLQGGIHKYLEQYSNSSNHFLGKEFVFDARVALGQTVTTGDISKHAIVGKCSDCEAPYDEYSGQVICTVCHMPVLCCPLCRSSSPYQGEFYCRNHRNLKGIYFHDLRPFSADQLRQQGESLHCIQQELLGHSNRNKRRTLQRQKDRIAAWLDTLPNSVSSTSPGAVILPDKDDGGAETKQACAGVSGVRAPNWGFWQS
jgi:predicted sulfurtransferase